MDLTNYVCEGQMSIFDCFGDSTPLKITKPIRLIELFAGVGSQAMALRNIGARFEHYRVVEFDKYAIASYNAIVTKVMEAIFSEMLDQPKVPPDFMNIPEDETDDFN